MPGGARTHPGRGDRLEDYRKALSDSGSVSSGRSQQAASPLGRWVGDRAGLLLPKAQRH